MLEVDEGEDALVNVEVLFGSLEKEVLVMLSTLDDSALGMYMYIYIIWMHKQMYCTSWSPLELYLCNNPVGGQDYTPVNSSITFSGSKSTEQLFISTDRDGLLEQAESFRVQLTCNYDDASVLLLPAQSKIVILDNNSKLFLHTIFYKHF